MRWSCTDAATRSSRSSSRIVAIPGPLPVRELMTASAFAVPRPQMPSTSRPQLRWKSSSAPAVSGPKMPSTRPQSNPSLPSSRLQRADVVAAQVRSQQLAVAGHRVATMPRRGRATSPRRTCRGRAVRGRAGTPGRPRAVGGSNDPASAPTGANPAPARRRCRSRIASPCCPGIRERKPEIRRAPAATGSCLVLR